MCLRIIGLMSKRSSLTRGECCPGYYLPVFKKNSLIFSWFVGLHQAKMEDGHDQIHHQCQCTINYSKFDTPYKWPFSMNTEWITYLYNQKKGNLTWCTDTGSQQHNKLNLNKSWPQILGEKKHHHGCKVLSLNNTHLVKMKGIRWPTCIASDEGPLPV